MPGFMSKLLVPFRSLRARAPASRPHTPTIEESNDHDVRLSTRIEAPERTRQRLDSLANYRIHSDEIVVTAGGFHGSGGKADVVQATFRRDDGSEEQVAAVKKIRSHRGIDQKKFSNEYVHEVEIMAGLSHKNIVRLVGFVEDLEDGKAWIVLSWEPNGNVSEFLATGTWEIPERVSLIQDTFEGVKYLHTRQPPICHGDLKSLNILVSSSYRAIITDFGSARAITMPEDGVLDEEIERQAQQNPATGQAHPQIDINAIGNQLTLTGPAYSLRWAPPEVVNGKRPGLSTDVWAAGWVAWEVMTDKVPFHEVNSPGAITLMVIKGEVPATREDAQLAQIIALCSLMKDCWAFDPKARPNIARCCTELKWIPSLPPSGGKASDRGVPSIDLLFELGTMHYNRGGYEKAASLFQEALSLARTSNKEEAVATALRFLGHVYRHQSKTTQAERSFTEAQEIFTRLGNDFGRADTLHGLGGVYRIRHEYTQAEESFTQAQEIFTRVGDEMGRGHALSGLGHVYRAQSKYTQAEESYTRAQEIYAPIGEESGRANTLYGLGNVYRLQSKYTQAEESYTRAREIFARIGDDMGRANVLCDFGELRRDQGRDAEAALHFAEAKDLYAQIGDTRKEKKTAERLAALSLKQNSATP